MARGRARGSARGSRGRGRGSRGRRAARVISSDEEHDKEVPTDETQPTETEDGEQQQSAATLANKIGDEKMEVDEAVDAATTTSGEVDGGADKSGEGTAVTVPSTDPIATTETTEKPAPEEQRQTFDMEADISQLEPPTFTTISRGPPEPMLRLSWDHKVNLIGEKVLNPMIYCCDQCDKPILIYGRMIPCKHVFCLKCARNETNKVCPRCKEKAIRVEQTGLGTVFMCTHGGSRYESKGCRRTYLSQRDLQAHINHRHINTPIIPRLESLAVKITDPADSGKSSSLPASIKRSDTRISQERTPGRSNSFSEGGDRMQTSSSGTPGTPGNYYGSGTPSHSSVITPTTLSQSHFSSYNQAMGGSNSETAQWAQSQYYR